MSAIATRSCPDCKKWNSKRDSEVRTETEHELAWARARGGSLSSLHKAQPITYSQSSVRTGKKKNMNFFWTGQARLPPKLVCHKLSKTPNGDERGTIAKWEGRRLKKVLWITAFVQKPWRRKFKCRVLPRENFDNLQADLWALKKGEGT